MSSTSCLSWSHLHSRFPLLSSLLIRYKTGSLNLLRLNPVNEGAVFLMFLSIFVGIKGRSILNEMVPFVNVTLKVFSVRLCYFFMITAIITSFSHKNAQNWCQILPQKLCFVGQFDWTVSFVRFLFRSAHHQDWGEISRLFVWIDVFEGSRDLTRMKFRWLTFAKSTIGKISTLYGSSSSWWAWFSSWRSWAAKTRTLSTPWTSASAFWWFPTWFVI